MKLQFRYATKFDKFLLVIGVICSILTGIAQPSSMFASASLNDVLLKVPPESPYFRSEGFKYMFIILAFGVVSLILSYVSVCFNLFITVRQLFYLHFY